MDDSLTPTSAVITDARGAREGDRPAAQLQPAVAAAAQERSAARALAEALDHAMERGLWEQANRLATPAARLASRHPSLAERLARLHLANGAGETALMILDSLPPPTASQRLLRVVALIQEGRRYEAHCDLRQWSLKAAAPLPARLMLAILEWEIGDIEAATAALMRNLRQIDDPDTLIALLLISAAAGNEPQMTAWADRLRAHAGAGATTTDVELVLRALGLPGVDARQAPPAARVADLATELLADEAVIPALAAAQTLAPHRPQARLLRQAIEQSLEQFHDQAAAHEALVQLSLCLGERDAAREWATRGTERCPLWAPLARLARDLNGSIATHFWERAA